jgi:hypothetical protein
LTPVPGERDADWQDRAEHAEQQYLSQAERYEYEGTR